MVGAALSSLMRTSRGTLAHRASWGRSRCNDFLLGVAFAGDTYAKPLTDEQFASALEWLEARWLRYGWSSDRMTDHRQTAPGRKDDLNPAEWERLRRRIEERFGTAD